MDLKKELTAPRSMIQTKAIVDWIGQNPRHIDILLDAYLGNDARVTQNAAFFMMHVGDTHPSLVKPHIGRLIEQLGNNPPVAIKRNTIRFLQSHPIPEEYQGDLAEHCFHYLTDPKEAIAIKAFSMTVLYNLTRIYPDLKNELTLGIKDAMENGTAGIISRGRKILKQLDKLG